MVHTREFLSHCIDQFSLITMGIIKAGIHASFVLGAGQRHSQIFSSSEELLLLKGKAN